MKLDEVQFLAYGHGITNAHAYLDGNKRTGFSAMDVFLGLNGYRLRFERAKWEGDVVVNQVLVSFGDDVRTRRVVDAIARVARAV